MILDLVELQHLPYITVDKGCAIVTGNPVGYSKPHNYIFLDEFFHCSSCGFPEWYCLCPLSEIFRNY